MNNILEKIIKSEKAIGIIAFSLLISVFANLYLTTQIVKNNRREDSALAIDSTESSYVDNDNEALILALEREIRQLEEAQGAGGNDTPEAVETDVNKEERDTVSAIVKGFSDLYLDYDSETEEARHELFSPYLTEQLLNTIALEESDEIFDGEHDHDITEVNYQTTVEDMQVFINEETLGNDNITALVKAQVKTQIDGLSSISERIMLDTRLIRTEEGYRINNIYYRTID